MFPTDHCLICFLEWIRDGEADWSDMMHVGGVFLVRELHRVESEHYSDE